MKSKTPARRPPDGQIAADTGTHAALAAAAPEGAIAGGEGRALGGPGLSAHPLASACTLLPVRCWRQRQPTCWNTGGRLRPCTQSASGPQEAMCPHAVLYGWDFRTVCRRTAPFLDTQWPVSTCHARWAGPVMDNGHAVLHEWTHLSQAMHVHASTLSCSMANMEGKGFAACAVGPLSPMKHPYLYPIIPCHNLSAIVAFWVLHAWQPWRTCAPE